VTEDSPAEITRVEALIRLYGDHVTGSEYDYQKMMVVLHMGELTIRTPLVGYTLCNILMGAKKRYEDKLFAPLNLTTTEG